MLPPVSEKLHLVHNRKHLEYGCVWTMCKTILCFFEEQIVNCMAVYVLINIDDVLYITELRISLQAKILLA
jgi:hypothetical protein